MNKNFLSLISAVSILIVSTGVARAVSIPDKQVKPDRWNEQSERWKEKFKVGQKPGFDKEASTRVCTNIQERVNARWLKYSTNREEKVANYDRGIKILGKRVEFYKSKGFSGEELANLTSDKAELEGMIAKYKSLYATFLTALGEAKTMPCANYQGKFLPELKEAKTAWADVLAQAEVIKNFYRDTVKPHMQELNAQIEDKVKETEEE